MPNTISPSNGHTAPKELNGACFEKKHSEPLNLTVLLADDNTINQKVATVILQKTGCMVDVVADGREALAAWQNKSYDLILMDLQMPEMDGLTATRMIRNEEQPGNRTPIIALTANAIDEVKNACSSAGMDDCLIKPFRKDELINIINKYVIQLQEM